MSQGRNSLEFEAYGSDPLAKLIIDRLDWSGKRFGSVYASFNLLLLALSIVIFWQRNNDPNFDLLGGYSALFAFAVAIIAVAGIGGAFYLDNSKKIGLIYSELADSHVLRTSDPPQRELLASKIDSIRDAHRRRIWPIVGVIFAVVFGFLLVYFTGFDPDRTEVTRARSILVVPQVAGIVGMYMVGMIIIRSLLTIWGLNKVFGTGNIDVHPLHPDGCGGLNDLKNYALSLAYMIAVLGFAIASILFITSQVVDGCKHHLTHEMPVPERCYDALIEDEVIMISDDRVVQLVTDDDPKLEDAKLHTDIGRTFSTPITWFIIVGYVVVAPLIFFGTLASAHRAMREQKMELLSTLSSTFDSEYRVLHGGLVNKTTADVSQYENLTRIHGLHEMTNAFPVWPWDMGTIRNFVAAVTALPVIPIVGSLVLEIAT